MDKFIIKGGSPIKGEIKVSGAKNVAMKVILAGLLTGEKIKINNVPLITSVYGTAELVGKLGVKTEIKENHTMEIDGSNLNNHTIPLDLGGQFRTATMVIGPLLNRFGKAVVPNPGGCRLGKRPVDWHIRGLIKMGASIDYQEGFFVAKATKLKGTSFRFPKNSHTGTETLILAAVNAQGETVIENASVEPEVIDLINFLNLMGANVKKKGDRTIVVSGVKKLKGVEYAIMPDRNEAVTFAALALTSGGDLVVDGARQNDIKAFLNALRKSCIKYQVIDGNRMRFKWSSPVLNSDIVTAPHPGFMTDWQSAWALLMTQAKGESTIHETIFEDRFGYVSELNKMGAKIEAFKPHVNNPKEFYNFNWEDRKIGQMRAIRIKGKTPLHEAILEMCDLRAGATLVLAASIARGESILYGTDHIDRGYEKIDLRLKKVGLNIKRIKE